MIFIKEIFSLILSIIGIILVLYLTYYGTKWLSTKTILANKSNYMNIVDKIMLGPNKYIAIVEITSQYYLISITESNINILKELEDFQELPNIDQDAPETFSKILNKFKNINSNKKN